MYVSTRTFTNNSTSQYWHWYSLAKMLMYSASDLTNRFIVIVPTEIDRKRSGRKYAPSFMTIELIRIDPGSLSLPYAPCGTQRNDVIQIGDIYFTYMYVYINMYF